MKEIETNFINKVINIMNNNGISEVTLENGAQSLYIKSGCAAPVITADIEKAKPEKNQEEDKSRYIPVISNMIGLFFLRPSPSSAPFIKTGDKVKKGQQLCIIETIKLMNKITAEVSGTVKEICIEDGRPVEYGQVMIYIEQD